METRPSHTCDIHVIKNTRISLANHKVQAQTFINRYKMDKLAKNNHKKPEPNLEFLKIE